MQKAGTAVAGGVTVLRVWAGSTAMMWDQGIQRQQCGDDIRSIRGMGVRGLLWKQVVHALMGWPYQQVP